MSCTRPLLRWHGGKWRLAPWIIAHFPPHRVYVEPFGGAASVLLRKERAFAEIYNDLDGDLVGLFRVLRDRDQAMELCRRLRLTPFARDEFMAAYQPADDPIERARCLIIRSFMGQGSVSTGAGKCAGGFRNCTTRSTRDPLSAIPSHDWSNYPDALQAIIDRFDMVGVERRPAAQLMAQKDGPDVLFYVDPPYLAETRSKAARRRGGKIEYAHELTDADHDALLSQLCGLQGMVVLSGYPATKYDAALAGWERVERAAYADGAAPRTEVLWLNPACARARRATGLFAQVAA